MSAIFLPRRWRHQPLGPLEVLPSFGDADAYSPNNAATRLIRGVGPLGSVAKHLNTSAYYGDFGRGLDGLKTLTLVVFFNNRKSGSLSDRGVFGTWTQISETPGYVHFVDRYPGDSSSRYYRLLVATPGAAQFRVNSPSGTVNEGLTMLVGTVSESNIALYQNGSLTGTTARPVTGLALGSQGPQRVGTYYDSSADRCLNADVYYALALRGTVLDAQTIAQAWQQPWMFFRAPSHRIWFDVGAGAPAAKLDADAHASAQASGALTTAIPLAGASIVATTSTGSLSTGIRLAGSAALLTQAQGGLTAQIRLQGSALSQAIAAAGLTNAIRLAAAAQAGAQASGTLTAPGAPASLAGDAIAAALAAGSITAIIRFEAAAVAKAIAEGTLAGGAAQLAGNAIAKALASGDLATAIRLAAAALGAASASGSLSTLPAGLSASATALAIAEGGLTTGINLRGAAASVVQASGTLDVAITFEAAAFAAAMATGVLSTQVRMEAAAVAGALARADLTGGMPVVPPAERTIPVRAQPRVVPVRAQTRLIPA